MEKGKCLQLIFLLLQNIEVEVITPFGTEIMQNKENYKPLAHFLNIFGKDNRKVTGNCL
jgi:hypothetical protein